VTWEKYPRSVVDNETDRQKVTKEREGQKWMYSKTEIEKEKMREREREREMRGESEMKRQNEIARERKKWKRRLQRRGIQWVKNGRERERERESMTRKY
jgi:hypothetical protein